MIKPLYSVPSDTLSEFVFHSNWIESYAPYDYPERSRLYRQHMAAAKLVVRTGAWDPLRLHFVLLDGLMEPEYVGLLRNMQVYVGVFEPPSPGNHLKLHYQRWLRMVEKGCPSGVASERWAWEVHDEFECVHPFIDGNGRTGRLILAAMRLSLGLPWLIVHQGDEQVKYYGHIRDYQTDGRWVCSGNDSGPYYENAG